MDKIFTSKFSDYTLFAVFFFVSTLFSCSTHVEQEVKAHDAELYTVAAQETAMVTVAAIESDEVYFDLIAQTSSCLGEDLWLGGKLESYDNVKLNKSGAISKTKLFRVTELTATGLNTNNSYLINDNTGTLRAKYDETGMIYLQLSEGKMQLKPYPSASPVVVAFQTDTKDKYVDGSLGRWTCN